MNEKFCHFYSNFGKCNFEVETGAKCKFTHKKAPNCKFDGNCNRKKCMYSHYKQNSPPGYETQPNVSQKKNHFLHEGSRFPTSPWQVQMQPNMFKQMWEIMGNQMGNQMGW